MTLADEAMPIVGVEMPAAMADPFVARARCRE
jgi:hypothetical protein